ncbi:MAG: hypothetical protein HY088_08560 [Ignavibacteriales bacterium]|nr:hypothetical protein [Ignavibacteriales bacterium]
MRTSGLFWGIVFLVLGGLVLLHNLNVLDVDWYIVWKCWPILLIFWGISLLIKKEGSRWYTVAFIIFIVLMLVAAIAAFEWFDGNIDDHWDFKWGDATNQTFSEPYENTIERASFTLESGAGKFFIDGTTDQLIDASTQLNFGRYAFNNSRSGDAANVSLSLKGRSSGWGFGRVRNRADIKLNVQPVWDIDVGVGASAIDFDLTPYKVSRLRIDAGAASLKVKLGDRSDETRVRVHAGASSLRIEVPSSVGCEVRTNTALSGKSLHGFDKISRGNYQTDNFDNATKRIYIDVDAGVSSIKVERY